MDLAEIQHAIEELPKEQQAALAAFLKRAELAGARVRFHLLDECAAGAAGGEIEFDLGFPFRLVALGDPGRHRSTDVPQWPSNPSRPSGSGSGSHEAYIK